MAQSTMLDPPVIVRAAVSVTLNCWTGSIVWAVQVLREGGTVQVLREGGRERGWEARGVRERERGEEVRDEGREDVRMRRIGLGDMEGVMYELPYAVKSINYSLSV